MSKQSNLQILSEPDKYNDFELAYLNVREKENRLYSISEIRKLPKTDLKHQHYKEWKLREASFSILLKHLKKSGKSYSIMDLGCGNGWMSNLLAKQNHQVTGIDINMFELSLASEAFQNENLKFVYADVFDNIDPGKFDLIILSASFQYFRNPVELLNHIRLFLQEKGKIIIMDSHFYTENEVKNAAKRSETYYAGIGFPEMAENYYHHSIDSLNSFSKKYIFRPGKKHLFINKLYFASTPFPIIEISF